MGAWRTTLNESGGVIEQQWVPSGSPRWPAALLTGKGSNTGMFGFMGWGRSSLQSQRAAESFRLRRMH